ncbi:60S ribosomal protein L6 [Cavenderia fasciculata]|uniref:Large ribosomal subunit protein eL6 n=1 Tax=Cavenderia fasciculata TaxID=261658 RepID=F4PTS5_CACFS|nr:60S ribosomal protein L6 [Cavenderia fasciculata]EGG20904.1 60S ribosomal protein L6 [Cavenderia fasciculata]|eukprot:XP_004358754.1 60S ribosomal protein L6 [Cavenderia fasciculata]
MAIKNPFIAKGVKRFSKRTLAKLTRTHVAKKNKVVTAKTVNKVESVKPTEVKNKKGQTVLVKKGVKGTDRFYPSDIAQIRTAKKAHPKPIAHLRKSITPGTVVILLAGKYAGKRVVFLKQLENSGLLLVSGPYKVNGVPLKRVDQRFVVATTTKVDISKVKVDARINDEYFVEERKKIAKVPEATFFDKKNKTVKTKKHSEVRVADQKAVDAALLEALKSQKALTLYLKTKFYLKKGQYPHEMKF